MSATSRGEDREEHDNYTTPDWLSEAVMPHILPKVWFGVTPYRILEPGCGDGAIVRVIERTLNPKIRHEITAVDIRDTGFGIQADFLEMEPNPIFDLVVTNPPYSLAQEYVDHGKKFLRTQKSKLVLLLRINFFGSQKRAAWWRKNMISNLYISSRRPSFKQSKKGSTTDATEYAWFEWRSDKKLPIVMLDTELDRFKEI